jgi:hypothetical protein
MLADYVQPFPNPGKGRVTDKRGLSARWLESKFARYWRVIYPRSVLIRRMWLRAIARKAKSR